MARTEFDQRRRIPARFWNKNGHVQELVLLGYDSQDWCCNIVSHYLTSAIVVEAASALHWVGFVSTELQNSQLLSNIAYVTR